MEPDLTFARESWCLFHANGGWVDNRALMSAMQRSVALARNIQVIGAGVESVSRVATSVELTLASAGGLISASNVVLAAGAWTTTIRGLPRALPLEAVRGQMLSVSGLHLNHVLIGEGGYAVPRPGGLALMGSTMERAGFNAETTEEGVTQIREGVAGISANLARSPEVTRWAGLRPITPDLLPVIGREPEWPALIYAFGHGRNGVLLSGMTSLCVGDLVCNREPRTNISPFRPDRWADK
jgi:glycine oxidase